MVKERILEAGWALLLTVPPNVRHVDRLRDAERRARERGAGLWASGDRARSAGPRATRATRTCASPLQTWTAGTSRRASKPMTRPSHWPIEYMIATI
jgi:hypothetical protein